jgi:membrane-associated protein
MGDLQNLIIAFGYLGIFTAIFAESGFLLGFFLPGDSLLFTIGLFAGQGHFNIFILMVLCLAGAILGDSFGYYVGKKVGPKIFTKEESFFFRKKNIKKTEEFFGKYGKKTIILARFVPIIRTFAPIMAGVGSMEYKTFLSYNIIGGFAWSISFLTVAYFFGKTFPGSEQYLSLIVLLIIFASILPIIINIVKARKK